MLNYWANFEFLPTLIIAMCGGILGVLFTIPLRYLNLPKEKSGQRARKITPTGSCSSGH